jgi:methyl-accepting chemotaxis protein
MAFAALRTLVVPSFEDENLNRQAFIVNVIALGGGAISLIVNSVLILQALFSDKGDLVVNVVVLACSIPWFLGMYALSRRGRVKAASHVVLWGGVAIVTYSNAASLGGTLVDPSWYLFALIVVGASLLMGTGWSIFFAGLGILIYLGLSFAAGVHPPATPEYPGLAYLVVMMASILFILALFTWLFRSGLEGALSQAQHRAAELAQYQQALEQRVAAEQKQREQMQHLIQSEQKQRESLQRILVRTRDAASNLGAASSEILAATTQQASGASEQSAAIAQTTTTVDELKTIAEQSVARAQEVAGTSQRTVEVSRAGREAVVEAIGSMGEIRARVEGIAENILTLSEQTQQVGEYGKGFAVVAAEVRSLAEQSRQATAQVRAILSDIQGATNATVMATEEGTKGVEEGMRLAGKAGEAIEELAGVIEESAQAAAQMMAGGRQQAAGVEQVAVAMQSINQATVQSLASTRQAEKAARELNDLACSLSDSVEQYRL